MNDRRRETLSFEPPPSELPRLVIYHALRWLPLVVLAVLTYGLYPVARGFDVPVFEVGDVAPVDVVAPFEFVVRKTPAERERDAAALAATVRPIYDHRPAALDSVLAYLDSLFDALERADTPGALADSAQSHGLRLTVDEARFLLEPDQRAAYRAAATGLANRELSRGVARVAAASVETSREVVLRRNGTERMVPVDSVPGWVEFLEQRRIRHPAPNSVIGDQAYVKLLNAAFQPTVSPNVQATDSLRAELRASVDTVKDQVRQNERIVAEHEVVTAEANDRLVALRSELLERGEAGRFEWPAAVGRVFTNALVLAIFWLLLAFYRRETYGSLRQVLVVAVVFGLVIGGAAANYRFVAPDPELIPIPFAAMLLTVLFSGRVAMVAAAVLAVLIAAQPAYGGTDALLVSLLAGIAAAIGIRMVRRRTQILVTMAAVSGTFAAVAVTVGLQGGWSFGEMGASALRGTLNALVSGALVSVALPVVESIARVTTDLTLLELSDPARPLLRRLATEAPGTYAHSIAMANLCEAACNAIEANGLLARVGCYYHDIGKLKKPQFFVENQGPGANPHDKLKPEVSAGIIRNHIKEGLQLADEAGLPDVIKAFVSEHHGTMEITYFLDRARARGEENPAPELYRYPGPRPGSVETAVAMLADGVEAAVRVLDDPTPEKVQSAIAYLVHQRVESGQLNDAPLTFAQLDRVKGEFLRVLSGVHHNRIDYPASTGGLSADWDAPPPA